MPNTKILWHGSRTELVDLQRVPRRRWEGYRGMNFRAGARCTDNLEVSHYGAHPFAHSDHADSTGLARGIKPAAVVAYQQTYFTRRITEADANTGRPTVPHDIIQGLLRHTE